MPKPQASSRDEVAIVFRDLQQLSRYYQALNHLDFLSDELSIKLATMRQQYDESKTHQSQPVCVILACQLVKLHHTQYGIAKQRVEVVRQLNEMINTNKAKIEAMIKSTGKTPEVSLDEPSEQDHLERKKRLQSFMKNKKKSKTSEKKELGLLDLSGQTCIDSIETLNNSYSTKL